MKTVTTYVVTLFLIGQSIAQNPTISNIETVLLSTRDLITHAADQYPSERPQKLFLLVETNNSKFNSDEFFYIQQGVKLLLKRLLPTDKLAIGTYGTSNEVILPFTEVSNILPIETTIKKFLSEDIKFNNEDGIDSAYQFILNAMSSVGHNKVIILRNDKVNADSVVAKQSSENVVSKNENNNVNYKKERLNASDQKKLGGAIFLTALSILPEILEVIKD